MDELLPDALARLSATVETLECRVYALEHPASNQQAPSQSEAIESPAAIPRTTSSPQSAGIFSVVGKAMLGIAGAYLLRAMAESTTFPRAVVVPVALSYAAMWLVAATRVKTEAKFASIAYAGTSVLILIPMLWELTLRFNFFSAAMAAAVLGAFVVASFFLAWRRHFAAVTWVTTAACSTAALIMAIATHDLVPFILAILAMTVASEAAAARDRSSFIRFWVAISADVAVCALIYIASRPAESRMDYNPVSDWLLLLIGLTPLLLYGASATAQTILRGRRITFFEASQTLVAFLLAAWSMLAFRSGGAVALGLLCLVASAAGYGLVYAKFGATTQQRNFHVYAVGSAALFLVGVYLSLPMIWLIIVLATAAIVATIVGVQTEHLTLEFHGLMFLWAAAFSSGLLLYIARALPAPVPTSPTGFDLDCCRCRRCKLRTGASFSSRSMAALFFGCPVSHSGRRRHCRFPRLRVGSSHSGRDHSRSFPRRRHPHADHLCSRVIACLCWFAVEAQGVRLAGLWSPGLCCVKIGV